MYIIISVNYGEVTMVINDIFEVLRIRKVLRRVLNEPTSFDSRCLPWGISGLKAAKRSKK
jgi:hypothetical protein